MTRHDDGDDQDRGPGAMLTKARLMDEATHAFREVIEDAIASKTGSIDYYERCLSAEKASLATLREIASKIDEVGHPINVRALMRLRGLGSSMMVPLHATQSIAQMRREFGLSPLPPDTDAKDEG